MRLLLVDDSALFRKGLARLLEAEGHEVVGQAEDTDGALALVRTHRPDVAVLDIRMPPSHTNEGLIAAERIRTDHPATGVLVLSQYVETFHAMRLLRGRPARVGYLLKDRVTDPSELIAALERVTAGECVIEPFIVSRLMSTNELPLARLSEREQEVLRLMAEGRTNAGIARQLFLTERTVESHVRSVLMKLGLEETPEDHRRVLAVLAYLRRDSPPD